MMHKGTLQEKEKENGKRTLQEKNGFVHAVKTACNRLYVMYKSWQHPSLSHPRAPSLSIARALSVSLTD